MADADGVLQIPVLDHRHQVAPEDPPVVRQFGLAAAAVPARIQREAATVGKHANDLVPASAVKSGGVGEQKRRVFPGPLPHCQLFSAFADEF